MGVHIRGLERARQWIAEPLFQFLVAGAVLFAFFAWKGEPADPASRTIGLSQEDRAQLAFQWERTMQRPPTDAELDALTETWVREEILYREALRLGLDRDDAVVRKRLANKMDYLASSMVETAQPSDETLAKWVADNPQRFAADTSYSFDQLYFADKADAEAALSRAPDAGDWNEQGDVISLPASTEETTDREIESRFGIVFLENLRSVRTMNEWSGPIVSGFGWHIVRLRGRKVGQVPALENIRDRVENDWRQKTLEQRQEAAYQLLRDAYNVSVK